MHNEHITCPEECFSEKKPSSLSTTDEVPVSQDIIKNCQNNDISSQKKCSNERGTLTSKNTDELLLDQNMNKNGEITYPGD